MGTIRKRNKIQRVYLTIKDAATKKSVGMTVEGASRDEVANKIEQLFAADTKTSSRTKAAA